MNIFFIAVMVSLFSTSAFAATLSLKTNTGTIFVTEKTDWKLGERIFGIPFMFFSPQKNGQRSNISFTNTGAEVKVDLKELNSKKFQDMKKEWASTVNAKPISFEPYSTKVNSHGHKIHTVGFNYEHEGKTYSEKSHYIECKGKLVFSKSLRLKENTEHEKDFSDLLNSVDCGGV